MLRNRNTLARASRKVVDGHVRRAGLRHELLADQTQSAAAAHGPHVGGAERHAHSCAAEAAVRIQERAENALAALEAALEVLHDPVGVERSLCEGPSSSSAATTATAAAAAATASRSATWSSARRAR